MEKASEEEKRKVLFATYGPQTHKEGVQKPPSRKMSVMEVPPLPPSRKAAGQKVNRKKVSGLLSEIFPPKTTFFA